MNLRFLLVIPFSLMLMACPPKKDIVAEVTTPVYEEEMISALVGDFNNSEQVEENNQYELRDLHIKRIWEEQGYYTIYIEEVDAVEDQTIKQEIYWIDAIDGDEVVAYVYSLKESENFEGKWNEPKFFDQYEYHEILQIEEGCELNFQRINPQVFSGKTEGWFCSSKFDHLSFETLEFSVNEEMIRRWWRGYNNMGEQVDGPTNGPYIFKK